MKTLAFEDAASEIIEHISELTDKEYLSNIHLNVTAKKNSDLLSENSLIEDISNAIDNVPEKELSRIYLNVIGKNVLIK